MGQRNAPRSGYPPSCAVCGEKVKMTGADSLAFHWSKEKGLQSYHAQCFLDRSNVGAVKA